MRVVCATLQEFLECLDNEKALFQDAIRVSISRTPFDGTQRDATKFKVIFQASAVVIANEESQYLLEVGKDCGRDIQDSEPSMEGTEVAQECRAKVRDYATSRGWRVLPGMISI